MFVICIGVLPLLWTGRDWLMEYLYSYVWYISGVIIYQLLSKDLYQHWGTVLAPVGIQLMLIVAACVIDWPGAVLHPTSGLDCPGVPWRPTGC